MPPCWAVNRPEASVLSISGILSAPAHAAKDETLFFFNDALGSAVAAVNESGDLCWLESYTPYGDKTIGDDAVSFTPGCGVVGEERGFTGHTEDYSTDLVYMQQRYYDPSLGRFLSIDPMDTDPANPVTINRYAYANNNPYKYTDPDGELAFLIPVAIFIAKELVAEAASEATGGLSDVLSTRRVATAIGKAGFRGGKKLYQQIGRNTSSGCKSFHEDTLVKTDEGYRRIVDIEPGVHEVWSKNKETGEKKLQPVMESFQTEYDETVRITVFDRINNMPVTVVSNTIHPYFVLKSSPVLAAALPIQGDSENSPVPSSIEELGSWVEASSISVGDKIQDFDGDWIEVTDVKIEQDSLTAYNIDVANFDTFFVSDSSEGIVDLWVHNCEVPKGGGRSKNNLEPVPDAVGDHTVVQRGVDGKIYKYETYEKTSSGHWNPVKRYDGGKPDGSSGAPHFNKKTGESIPTPHVQGKSIPGGARPAEPWEIPK